MTDAAIPPTQNSVPANDVLPRNTATMDKPALELAAIRLEALLDQYAVVDQDAALLRGSLMPLVSKAKAGQIDVAMDWRQVPGEFFFNERGLRQYRDLETAYSRFVFAITAWEPVLTEDLRPK